MRKNKEKKLGCLLDIFSALGVTLLLLGVAVIELLKKQKSYLLPAGIFVVAIIILVVAIFGKFSSLVVVICYLTAILAAAVATLLFIATKK